MNLRDHDQPCQHTDTTDEYGYSDGAVIDVHTQLWTCEYEDCPGGVAVTIEPIRWCEVHRAEMVDGAEDGCVLEDPPRHFIIEATDG